MEALSLFLLALCIPALVHADDIWTPHIHYGPAPAPDQRPPLARGATYDLSLLAYQIPAILGSYVAVIAIIGICILTFGRRMRKEAQTGPKPLTLEMVKPKASQMEPSPKSPSGSSWMGRWGTPRLGSRRSNASTRKSPKAPSVMSFDSAVLLHDKVAREEEMAKIYGEIIRQGQDVKAPKTLNINERSVYEEPMPASPGPYMQRRNPSTSSRSFSRRDPPQRNPSQQSHQSRQNAHLQLQHRNDHGGGARARHPPSNDPRYLSQTNASMNGFYPVDMLAASPSVGGPLTSDLPASPPPYSHSRQPSAASSRTNRNRPSRTSSVRGLSISNPIPISTVEDDIAAQAQIPKSPRYYSDGSHPPMPSVARPERERPTTMIDETPMTAALERPITMIEDAPPTAGFGRSSTPIEDDSDHEPERGRPPGRVAFRSPDRSPESSEEEEIETDDEYDHERHHNATPESIIHAYGEPRTPRPPPRDQPRQQSQRQPEPPPQPLRSPISPTFPFDQNPPSRTTTPGQSSLRSMNKTPPALNIQPPSRSNTPAQTTSPQKTLPREQLPFRAIQPPPQSPGLVTSPGIVTTPSNLKSPGLPKSPGPQQITSPGGTKTTFLSPKRDKFLPGGMQPMNTGMGTAVLRPKTAALFSAGLATPYSPYMPATPMTPLTPHLTTRQERREQERERGRFAATEEDIVEAEEDMWGDAYR